MEELQRKPRGKPRDEAPYVWQSAAALECILAARRESGDAKKDAKRSDGAALTIAVYVALTRIASLNRNASRFQSSVKFITRLAGVSDSAARKQLKALERLGLIKIEHQWRGMDEKLPSYFTLVSLPQQPPGPLPQSGGVRSQGAEGVRLHRAQEKDSLSKRERESQKEKGKSAHSSSATAPLGAGGAQMGAKGSTKRPAGDVDDWMAT